MIDEFSDSFIYKNKKIVINTKKKHDLWLKRFHNHSCCVVHLVQNDIDEFYNLFFALQNYELKNNILKDSDFNY